jgi:hypothetical protein
VTALAFDLESLSTTTVTVDRDGTGLRATRTVPVGGMNPLVHGSPPLVVYLVCLLIENRSSPRVRSGGALRLAGYSVGSVHCGSPRAGHRSARPVTVHRPQPEVDSGKLKLKAGPAVAVRSLARWAGSPAPPPPRAAVRHGDCCN